MKIGLLLLLIGSTGVGARISLNRQVFLRAIAIILSPVLVFGLCLLFSMITNPLIKYSSLWYAQQEAPIAVAVVVNLFLGILLYKTYKPAVQ
jgi:cytochrome c biogenesis protein CcdA